MATAHSHTLLRHLHTLAASQALERTNRQLLDDFTDRRDESAFAILVARHGPMVLRVCRRVLGHEQDAEDAFQAAFLVLARNSRSVRKPEALAAWLHGVAFRTAMKAKRGAARRRTHEAHLKSLPAKPPASPSWDDVQAVLDEEIQRLPESFRMAFVLCVLEGKSVAEAAACLQVKPGTVSSRLTRARQRLQRQLARRGIQLTILLAALSVAEGFDRASVPALLSHSTIRLALSVEVIPLHIAALAAGVTRAMFLTKIKIATAAVFVLGLVTAGAGLLAHRTVIAREQSVESPQPEVHIPKAKTGSAKAPALHGNGDRVEVSGRVVDPDGKPVAGAKVVLHQRHAQGVPADFFPASATGTTDSKGRFRFSGSVHLNAPTRDYPPWLVLTAHVPGLGPAATVELTSPDELKDRTLRLVKDDVPIRGRILNLEGKPIAGVTVRPVAVTAFAADDLGSIIQAIETNSQAGSITRQRPTSSTFSAVGAGLTQKAVTGDDGRFTLSGFGRERIVVLRLDGPTIETCLVSAMTRLGPAVRASRRRPGGGGMIGGIMPPKRSGPAPSDTYVWVHGVPFDFIPGPEMIVEGTVRDQDTDKPLAGVVVGHQIDYDFGRGVEESATKTDAEGNYRLAGLPRPSEGLYQVVQFIPPKGQPYLRAGFTPSAPELGKAAKLDVHLKRGVWVKGRVTDKATGRPVQAVVQYFAFVDNPNLQGIKGFAASSAVSSKEDGSFTLAALRGPGVVAVKTDEMRWGMYLSGQGADAISGPRDEWIKSFVTRPYLLTPSRFNTLAGIEPDAKLESISCDVQLDPGKTVKGTILDPNGKPLAGVRIRGMDSLLSIRELPSEAFTIPAIDPRKPEALFFEHPQKKLAAAVLLKGDEPDGFTVKLQPTATIVGRLVTETVEPIRNTYIGVRLEAGQFNMTRTREAFFRGDPTDAEGRFKVEGLPAGVKLGASTLFANVKLQPGEVRDLGDIKVRKESPE
jgi:RNA polymerase sigma factor (sigma-70 family)